MRIQLLIGFLLAFLVTMSAIASTVTTQGKAAIKQGMALARMNAYDEALRQASHSAGVNVSSSSSIDANGTMTDSLQLRSSSQLESSSIISEKVEDGILTVTIEAEYISTKESCDFPASQYRKKIAATYFPMLHPEHIGIIDYYDFDKAMSTEILQRLSRTGNFLTREARDITLYEDPAQAPFISKATISDDTLLSQIALNRDVQYVVSGVIRDLSFEIESDRYEHLPLVPSVKSFFGYQRNAVKRNIVIDFFLHDTLTGELLSKNTYNHSISGYNVIPEVATAFGTKAFYDSDYGKLFAKILDQEVKNISNVLSCRPFTMRVIDQKDGYLYLNAGHSNRVRPGDVLTIYIPDKPGETFGVTGKVDQFGMPKTTIKINKVYPAYSIATPESGTFSHQDIINGYLIAW